MREHVGVLLLVALGAVTVYGGIMPDGQFLRGAVNPKEIKTAHLIFMTHLDIGYTNTSKAVCDLYFKSHYPNAIKTARAMRDRGGAEQYQMTSHPWLILEYLTGEAGCTDFRPTNLELSDFKDALTRGDITWQANAFSMFAPLVPESLLSYSLSLSDRLDKLFGKEKKFSAKQEDTMGYTVAAIPTLVKAGIRSLHMGVNSNCQGPDVPPAFVWRHEDSGDEVLAMVYNKPSAATPCSAEYCTYGGDVILPGFEHALIFDFQPDNTAPATVDQVLDMYARVKKNYPNAKVVLSSMDAYTLELEKFKSKLPVITQEIGDSWSYGAPADPVKIAGLKLMADWLQNGEAQKFKPEDVDAYRSRLIKLRKGPSMWDRAEHNWGLSTSVFFNAEHYNGYWSNKDFQRVRRLPDFIAMEKEWDSQRRFLLPLPQSPLYEPAKKALKALAPMRPSLTGDNFKTIALDGSPVKADVGLFKVSFDPKSGSIVSLVDKKTGKVWADQSRPLGTLYYQTFSMASFDRFNEQFNPGCGPPCGDFSKPGMDTAGPIDAVYSGKAEEMAWRVDGSGQPTGLVVRLSLPKHLVSEYGAAEEYWVEYEFQDAKIDIKLQWFKKTATRLAEATWLGFNPAGVDNPKDWRVEVMGRPISPYDVVSHGTRNVHATSGSVFVKAKDTSISIRSIDSALVGPGSMSLINFDDSQPTLEKGWFMNVHSNLWGTAFPQWWYEADSMFRFSVETT